MCLFQYKFNCNAPIDIVQLRDPLHRPQPVVLPMDRLARNVQVQPTWKYTDAN